MNKNRNKNYCCLFTILIVICCLHVFAYADDESREDKPSFFDYTNDQIAYGEMIARLNRIEEEIPPAESELADSERKRGSSTAYCAVLCRTDGRDFPFESWNPRYIIAGPSNCYTLFFESNTEAEKAVEELSSNEGIRYAELDSPVEACGEADPTFRSWGAESMNFGPYLTYTEACSVGSALVAVIDSGTFFHSMYTDRILESGYDYVDADNDPVPLSALVRLLFMHYGQLKAVRFPIMGMAAPPALLLKA